MSGDICGACTMCGSDSYVAFRDKESRCAECQMACLEDDVVIDALSRAICAVIADAVKDERKQAAKAADERRLAEQVAWANVTNDVKACPHGRPKGCSCSTCWPDAKPFISKNKPAMTSDEAHAAFMIRHGVATPLERQAAHDQPQVCAKCSTDLAYAAPGQVLCYGCRST